MTDWPNLFEEVYVYDVHYVYLGPVKIIKGTLMQIWKSPYMFVFTYK